MRRFEWDQFTRMAIEDLPEPLPEMDMYCRGVPFDSSSDQVQHLSPGGEVGVEWDIVQPDGGNCAIKLVCPSRQFKQELWRGPCGMSPGKARSQALIPNDFSCSKGECFITWYYETASRRRFCNCFDIVVPSSPSEQPSDTFVPTDSPNTILSSADIPVSSTSPIESIVFTSTEISSTTVFTAETDTVTSSVTSLVELPGSSLEGGIVKTDAMPTVYMTATAPSSKIELSGVPLSAAGSQTCSSDTIIVTMIQTQLSIITNSVTTTCTETSIMTMPVERLITIISTSTCTETMQMLSTVTESALPSTLTVYMTSLQTAYITTTVSLSITDSASPAENKSELPTANKYRTQEGSASPMTVKIPRSQVKYY